jgi:hypothetical protein
MARSKPRKPQEPRLVPTAVQQVEIAALHGFIDKAERGEPLTAEEAQALRTTVSTTAFSSFRMSPNYSIGTQI